MPDIYNKDFAKLVYGEKSLTIFAKSLILGVLQGSKYASVKNATTSPDDS